MSKTRGADVWARPLSGARGVEKERDYDYVSTKQAISKNSTCVHPHWCFNAFGVNSVHDKIPKQYENGESSSLVSSFFWQTAKPRIAANIWYGQGQTAATSETHLILNYCFTCHCGPGSPVFFYYGQGNDLVAPIYIFFCDLMAIQNADGYCFLCCFRQAHIESQHYDYEAISISIIGGCVLCCTSTSCQEKK